MSTLYVSAQTQDFRDMRRNYALDRWGGRILEPSADLVLDGAPEVPAQFATGFLVKVGKPDCNSKITFTPYDVPTDQAALTVAGFKYSGKGFYWRKNVGTDTPELLTELAQSALGSGEPPEPPAASTERPLSFTQDEDTALGLLILAMLDEVKALYASYETAKHERVTIAPIVSENMLLDLVWAIECELKMINHEGDFFVLESGFQKAMKRFSTAAERLILKIDGLAELSASYEDRVLADEPIEQNQQVNLFGEAVIADKVHIGQPPLPMGRPVFGELQTMKSSMPINPETRLELQIQDSRTDDEIEAQRMKAAEALTVPMFGEVKADKPVTRLEALQQAKINCGDLGRMKIAKSCRGEDRLPDLNGATKWLNREVERYVYQEFDEALKAESPKAPNVRVNEQYKPDSLADWFGPKQERPKSGLDERTVESLFDGRNRNSYPLGTILVSAPRVGKSGKYYGIMLYRTKSRYYVKFYVKRSLSIDVKKSTSVSQIMLQVYNRLPDGMPILGYERDGTRKDVPIKPCPDCGGPGSKRRNSLCDDCYQDYFPPAGDNMTAREIRAQVKLCREL